MGHTRRGGYAVAARCETRSAITPHEGARCVSAHWAPAWNDPLTLTDTLTLTLTLAAAAAVAATAAKAVGPWPKRASEQFAAVRDLLATRASAWSAGQVQAAFKGAPADEVEEMMATLVVSGQAVGFATPEGERWQRAG